MRKTKSPSVFKKCSKAANGGSDCASLSRVLESQESVPDHICPATQKASCTNWLNGHPGYDHNRVGDLSYFPSIELTPGVSVVVRGQDEWPLPLNSNTGYLRAVIRQWIEESRGNNPQSDGAFAKILERTPEWKTLVGRGVTDEKDARNLLRGAGFLANRSTVAYYIHRASGLTLKNAVTLPCRALLVTSYFVVPAIAPPQSKSMHIPHLPEPLFCVTGSRLWVPDTLWREVPAVVRRHAELCNAKQIDLRAVNRGRAGSGDTQLTLDIQAHLAGKMTKVDVIHKHEVRCRADRGTGVTDTELKTARDTASRMIRAAIRKKQAIP